ncbi:hypothetical protein FE257_011106 [Aspergillus nanangensis]|uniref:Uncharacterized protein n=1 Tax=Aspergillus nanangensis TaxID=2582783 RepID=A0AAD4CHS0_ASPNN|nr:hypothetical protein FE257_011106 [Aspergillus nanangensis]
MGVLKGQSCLTLCLLLLLATLSIARVEVEHSHVSELEYGLNTTFSALHARQNDGCTPEPNCSPSTCSDSVCNLTRRKKRSLPVVQIGSNGDITDLDLDLSPDSDKLNLLKRTLRGVRQNGINNYLERQNGNDNLVNLCPADAGGYGTPSYCVQYKFTDTDIPIDPNTGQMLIGTGNTELTGCTVLTIASSKGVYMCHFWQDVNYPNQGATGRPDRPALGFQPVLNMLRGEGDRRWAVGPAIDKSLFVGEGTTTWAFICTPRAGGSLDDPQSYHYTSQQDQLVAVLRDIIPGVGIVNYNYYWVLPYEQYYQGVALFEYDRDADGKGNSDWRLWLEASNEKGTTLGQNPN